MSDSAKTVSNIQRVILYGMKRSREDQWTQVFNLWVWELKGIANEENLKKKKGIHKEKPGSGKYISFWRLNWSSIEILFFHARLGIISINISFCEISGIHTMFKIKVEK